MKKIMKKIMSYMLITAVLITNLALVPVAASQEDATEKSDEVQETSKENADAGDLDKAEKKNMEDKSNTVPAAKDNRATAVNAPTATPESAIYKNEQTIKLECSTPNTEIYYTIDGSEPSNDPANTSAKKYDAEFKVTANTTVNPAVAATTTVKAVAYDQGNKSEVAIFEYTIDPNYAIAKPAASVEPDTYKNPKKVTLSCETKNVKIYYTVNNSIPDPKSPDSVLYTEGTEIDIDNTTTLKAIAFGGDVKSEMLEATYTIDPNLVVEKPTTSLAEGTYHEDQETTLLCGTAGAEVYYTTDGSDPDRDKGVGKKYNNEKIPLTETMQLKAIAYFSDTNSGVVSFNFTIEKIRAVTVKGVTAAVNGEKPISKANVPKDANYEFVRMEWMEKVGESKALQPMSTERFQPNMSYYPYITLRAKAGYQFDQTTLDSGLTTAVTIEGFNGKSSVMKFQDDEIVVASVYLTGAVKTASADDNKITGIKSTYAKNATVTFNAIGAGSANEEVHGNERYIPVEYQVGSKSVEITDGEAAVSRSFKVASAGTYKVQVTFQKQVYDADAGDGGEWKDVADEIDVKSTSFKVTSKSPGRTPTRRTAKPTKTSSTRAKNARTADETPIGTMAAVCLLAGTAAVVMTVRRRKNR